MAEFMDNISWETIAVLLGGGGATKVLSAGLSKLHRIISAGRQALRVVEDAIEDIEEIVDNA